MHHFLIEFITGGGLSGLSVPESLRREGELMFRALLNDLQATGPEAISFTRDKRFSLETDKATQYLVDGPLEDAIKTQINASHSVWLVAPETDDCLLSLTKLLQETGATVIASASDVIQLTASKLKTTRLLQDAGVATIPTITPGETLPVSRSGWIVKPDDGVGAEQCYRFNDEDRIQVFLNEKSDRQFIIQPYIEGEHLSVSLLANNGDCRLLACNRQYLEWDKDTARFTGVGVNECLSLYEPCSTLAKQTVAALPGLAAYVGIDLIKTDDQLLLVEINPRLTTAYAGLSQSLDQNVAELICQSFLDHELPELDITAATPVRINV